MRLAFSLALAASLLALPARADSGHDLVRLVWAAPAGCPSGDDVRAAALRSVGTMGASPPGDPLEAEATVEGSSDRWTVHLRTRRGASTGERTITATTCSGVADAVGVVLALALVPPGTIAEPPLTPERTVHPRGPVAEAPPEAREREGPPLIAIGASLAADASMLPALAMGGSLSLALTPGRIRFEADVRRWSSQSVSAAASDAGARFSLTSVGPRACMTVAATHGIDLAPCAGADLVVVAAAGYGADANFDRTARWVSVAVGGLVRAHLTRWLAMRARIEGSAPLARPTFVVENIGLVHRPLTFGAAASLGAEVSFL